MSSSDRPSLFSEETCSRKGLCPITSIRGQSSNPLEEHSLYYGMSNDRHCVHKPYLMSSHLEIHGKGSTKVVLIMGLNSSSFSWGKQVGLLAREHIVLVFDNRGVGYSSTPRGPYSCDR